MPLDGPIDLGRALAYLTPEEAEGVSDAALFCWDPDHDRLCFSDAALALKLADLPQTGWTLSQALTLVCEESMRAAEAMVAAIRRLEPCGPVELTLSGGEAHRVVEVRTLPVRRMGRAFIIGGICDRT